MFPAVRQQSTATLHEEHPPSQPVVAMPSLSPSTHPATCKAKPAGYIPPLPSCTLAAAPLPGMPLGPESLLCALSPS